VSWVECGTHQSPTIHKFTIKYTIPTWVAWIIGVSTLIQTMDILEYAQHGGTTIRD